MAQFNFWREMSETFGINESELVACKPDDPKSAEEYRDLLGTIAGTDYGRMAVGEETAHAFRRLFGQSAEENIVTSVSKGTVTIWIWWLDPEYEEKFEDWLELPRR